MCQSGNDQLKQDDQFEVRSTDMPRLYVKCYHDFLKSPLLNGDEKIMFLMLKMFVDIPYNHGKVTPTIDKLRKMTGWGRDKVIKILSDLDAKHIIVKFRGNRNQPNTYLISDSSKMWDCETLDQLEVVRKDVQKEWLQEVAASMGYEVVPKTELESKLPFDKRKVPGTAHQQPKVDAVPSTNQESQSTNNCKAKVDPCQVQNPTVQRDDPSPATVAGSRSAKSDPPRDQQDQPVRKEYSMDFIHNHYEIDYMIDGVRVSKDDVDCICNIIYDALNTTKKTLRIGGEDKSADAVRDRLLELSFFDVGHVIDKFKSTTDRVKNVGAYILTMLYYAKQDEHFGTYNQAKHDMFNWNSNEPTLKRSTDRSD